MKTMNGLTTIVTSLLTFLTGSSTLGYPDSTKNADIDPFFQTCVHDVGDVSMCVSNFGVFGSEDGDALDCKTGEAAASFEFPENSGLEYLFHGALWIGTVRGRDTLVTTGADYYSNYEFAPCSDSSCGLKRLSRQPSDDAYSSKALSDCDFVVTFTDTSMHHRGPNGTAVAGHRPIGVSVTQKSYSWSGIPIDEFVLYEYTVSALSNKPVKNARIGIWRRGARLHVRGRARA